MFLAQPPANPATVAGSWQCRSHVCAGCHNHSHTMLPCQATSDYLSLSACFIHRRALPLPDFVKPAAPIRLWPTSGSGTVQERPSTDIGHVSSLTFPQTKNLAYFYTPRCDCTTLTSVAALRPSCAFLQFIPTVYSLHGQCQPPIVCQVPGVCTGTVHSFSKERVYAGMFVPTCAPWNAGFACKLLPAPTVNNGH